MPKQIRCFDSHSNPPLIHSIERYLVALSEVFTLFFWVFFVAFLYCIGLLDFSLDELITLATMYLQSITTITDSHSNPPLIHSIERYLVALSEVFTLFFWVFFVAFLYCIGLLDFSLDELITLATMYLQSITWQLCSPGTLVIIANNDVSFIWYERKFRI